MISHCIRPIEINGETQFEVWYGNTKRIIQRPFDPYFWSTSVLENIKMCNVSKEEKILLKTRKKKKLLKYEFPSVKYVKAFRNSDYTMEDGIPFDQRVTINDPNFYRKFQYNKPLKIMALDFEMFSEGIFPRASRDPIIGAGYSFSILKDYTFIDEEPVIHLCKPKNEFLILDETVKAIQKFKPNFIVTFYGNKFDIPYFVNRLLLNNISIIQLSYDRTYPKFTYEKYTDEFGNVRYDKNRIKEIMFGGITNIDLSNEVEMDQTLSGIKNRKMKTVARWFKITDDPKELDVYNMKKYVMTKKLYDYLKSDVIITRELFKIYYSNMRSLSDVLGIPFNMVASRSWSHIPILIHGREMYKRGIVGDLTNQQYYPNLNWGSKSVYEGAIVELYLKGLFQKVYQIDFKSYYPSTMVKFNLSPETCFFHPKNPFFKYNPNGFKHKIKNGYLHLIIPDKNIGYNCYILVNLQEEGSLVEFIRRMKIERALAKMQMKKYDYNTTEYIKFYSKQWSCKICQTVEYGYNGTKFAIWGNLPVAIATCGIDRFILQNVINNWIPKIKIETDTDGIYIKKWIDIELMNNLLNNWINKTFQLDNEDELILELDEYGKGYFYGMKNYVLQKLNGDLKIMGSALKGKNKCGIFDRSLEILARAIIEEDLTPNSPKSEIEKIYMNCMKLLVTEPLEAFAMNCTLKKKHLWEYNKSTLYYDLGKQVEAHGIEVQQGEQITYVKTKDGYKIITDSKKSELDMKYYKNEVHKAFIRLGFEEFINNKIGKKKKVKKTKNQNKSKSHVKLRQLETYSY